MCPLLRFGRLNSATRRSILAQSFCWLLGLTFFLLRPGQGLCQEPVLLTSDDVSFNDIAFAPNGNLLAVANYRATVWDLAGPKPKILFHTDFNQSLPPIDLLQFSTDGKTLYTARRSSEKAVNPITQKPEMVSVNLIRSWDVVTGREKPPLKVHGGGVSLAFSPDGKVLATRLDGPPSLANTTVWLWSVTDGKKLAELDAHLTPVRSVAFSPDGKLVATSDSRQLIVWDRRTGKELHSSKRYSPWIIDLAFSPDGKLVAGATSVDHFSTILVRNGRLVPGGRSALKLWDAATGKEARSMQREVGRDHSYACVAFAPDGKTIVTSRFSITTRRKGVPFALLQLWDVATGELRRRLEVPTNWHVLARFSPDGKKLVAAAAKGNLFLWDLAKLPPVSRPEPNPYSLLYEGIEGISLSRDGTKVVALTAKSAAPGEAYVNYLRAWDLRSRKQLMHVELGESYAKAVHLTADGKTILAAGGVQNGNDRTAVNTLKTWDLATGHLKASRQVAGGGRALGFSPDGKILATCLWRELKATRDPTIHLWDVATGKELPPLKGCAPYVSKVAFSPDSQRIATVAYSRPDTIQIWECHTGKAIAAWRTFPAGYVEGLAFSPDGQLLAAAGNEKQTRPHESVHCVKLWGLAERKEVRSLPLQVREYGCIAFTPDGKTLLASCGREGREKPAKLQFWHVPTGKLQRELENPNSYAKFIAVVFLSDDKKLLTSDGAYLFLWDLEKPLTSKPKQ